MRAALVIKLQNYQITMMGEAWVCSGGTGAGLGGFRRWAGAGLGLVGGRQECSRGDTAFIMGGWIAAC